MTDGLDVVTVRSDDEGRIVVRMVVRPEAGRPIVFSSRCQGGTVERVDLPAIFGCERDVKRHRLMICGAEPKRGLLSAPQPCSVGDIHHNTNTQRSERLEE